MKTPGDARWRLRRRCAAAGALFAVSLLAASLTSQTVAAQQTDLDRRTREVASQLRCPVCQGLSINDSPAELAIEMKGVVREQLAAGKTPDEVRAFFIAKYGEWVLLEPEPRGFNLLVYALPVLAVVGGALFVWAFVRRSIDGGNGGNGGNAGNGGNEGNGGNDDNEGAPGNEDD